MIEPIFQDMPVKQLITTIELLINKAKEERNCRKYKDLVVEHLFVLNNKDRPTSLWLELKWLALIMTIERGHSIKDK